MWYTKRKKKEHTRTMGALAVFSHHQFDKKQKREEKKINKQLESLVSSIVASLCLVSFFFF